MEKLAKIILLKKIKFSEADLIIHSIDSSGRGLRFIARSALKSKKRFGGGLLEPGNYLKVSYKEKAEGLHTLHEASMINDFRGIRSNYERIELALYFIKLIEKATHEGQEDLNNFNLLGNALNLVQTTHHIENLKALFQAKYLYYQGVLQPDIIDESIVSKNLADHEELNLEAKNLKLMGQQLHLNLEQFLN